MNKKFKETIKNVSFDMSNYKAINNLANKYNITFSGAVNLIITNFEKKLDSLKISDEEIKIININFPQVGRPMTNEEKLKKISDCIQKKLKISGSEWVSAIEAAQWLEQEGILKDSMSRPGLPLRNILRNESNREKIAGARQIPPVKNGRWFIYLEK